MAVKCSNCGGSHPKWDCTKPLKESAAPRKDVVRGGSDEGTLSRTAPRREHVSSRIEPKVAETCNRVEPRQVSGNVTAGTQALPAGPTPKPKIGRPRTGFDKKEYNRKFTADLRTIKRLGLSVTVAQYRKSKET